MFRCRARFDDSKPFWKKGSKLEALKVQTQEGEGDIVYRETRWGFMRLEEGVLKKATQLRS
jgi:hypothetical protein